MALLSWLFIYLLTVQLPGNILAELWAHYVRSPESITTPLGDDVVFTCQTSNRVEKIVWWHRKLSILGTPPAPWTQITFMQTTYLNPNSSYLITAKPASSTLTVKFRDETLAGEYRCVSWNGASALASVPAKLNMAWLAPAPQYENRQLIVAPNTPVFIHCPPLKSDPPPTMIYYEMVNGNPVDVESDKDSGGLVMYPKNNSTTVYTCAARNSHTEELHTYNHRITVIAQKQAPKAPEFEPDMEVEVIGREGKSIALACLVNGYPAPKILWKRKDKAMLHHAVQADFSPLLHLSNLHVSDRGEYECIASNNVGTAKKVVKLRVWHAARLSHDKGERPKDEEVQEGSSVRLTCGQASGDPKPTFYWLLNGGDISKDPSVKMADTELVIDPVEKQHAGVVQCFATNVLGSAYTGRLLRVSPKELMLQGNKDDVIDEIQPVRPNPRGNKARGRHTQKPKRKNHKVMIPPSRPNITRLSDESVMVRWSVQHNNGLRIEFFKVQYKDTTLKTQWNTLDQTIPANVHSYEVGSLTAGHNYTFRISAVYSNEDNLQGYTSKFLLQHGADLPLPPPPTPVLNRTEAVNTTAIRLYWDLEPNMEMTKHSQPIEGFYVYYRPTSTAGDYVKEAVEGGSTRTHTLTYLSPGVQYEIKLKSFSLSIASGFSQIITQGTLKPAIEKPNEISTLTKSGPSLGPSTASNSNNNQVYGIAGGAAAGVAFLIAIILGLIMYRRRRDESPDKQGGNANSVGRNSGVMDALNGYIPSGTPASNKPTITITSNPLHPENESVDMEMSYISAQNNNCSTESPRNSTEVSVSIPSSCREEMRKQNPITSLPVRENYV